MTVMEEILEAAAIYSEDLNFTDVLKSEVKLRCEHWKNQTICPITAARAMDHCKIFYPHIQILLNILTVISVTSVTAERTFSVLRRAIMTENWLNGLAHANIHKDISISISELMVISL